MDQIYLVAYLDQSTNDTLLAQSETEKYCIYNVSMFSIGQYEIQYIKRINLITNHVTEYVPVFVAGRIELSVKKVATQFD